MAPCAVDSASFTHAPVDIAMTPSAPLLRTLALCALVVVACTEDGPRPSDATTDIGSDGDVTVQDVEAEAAAELPQETEDDVAPDAASETSSDDVEGDADIPVIPPDGLIGSPCSEDADCNITGTDQDACFLGFCTTRCRQSGELIAGACNAPGSVSEASPYGTIFGCPDDLIYCTPGTVTNVEVICSKDADCAMGPSFSCAAAILIGNKKVDGVCLPTADRAPSGSDCFDAQTCSSLLCLGEDVEANEPGQCASHCTTNADCPGAGDLCIGIGFNTDPELGVVGAWAGLCSDRGSSQTYCNKATKCADGERCQVFVEPSSLGPQYWCVPEIDGGLGAGEACDSFSDCASGRCFFGGVSEVGQGYCVTLCPGGADDCSYGTCEELSLTAAGTPDNPNDDPSYEACVFGAEDDYCFVDEPDFCEADLLCEQVPDATNNLGTCTVPPGCGSGSVVCDDQLACTIDVCSDNTCTTDGLVADTCLIDGACYDAGDPDPTNPCRVCAPSVANDGWTDVDDGDPCEAGDLCLTGDTCQQGSCTEGTTPVVCDDQNACNGVETCGADGQCQAGTALPDGDPCEAGDLCLTGDTCQQGSCTEGSTPDTSACPTVNIGASGFGTTAVTIPVGATVTWSNADTASHSVVIASLSVDSGALTQGQSFSHTFTSAGSFAVTDGFSAGSMTVNVQ